MTEIDPSDTKAQLEAAEQLRQSGHFDEAATLFQQVLARKPRNVPASLGAARCALQLGSLARAIVLFTTAAENEQHSRPLLELGAECLKAGHMAEAELSYQRAAALAPDQPEPYRGLANCARRRGDRAGALEWQQQVCALAPENLAATLQLGKDLQELQRTGEARAVFEAALRDYPDDARALKAAATLARQSGDTERALYLLHHAAQAEPGLASATHGAGPGRDGAAAGTAAQEQASNDARSRGRRPAWLQIALLERSNGHVEAALAAFEQAHAADPTNVKIIRQLAREHRVLGHQDRAQELLALAAQIDPEASTVTESAAVEREPDGRNGRRRIALLLEEAAEHRTSGRLDEAELRYRRAGVAAPNMPDPLLGLAACARKRGDRSAALEWQRRACALAPDNLAAQVDMGRDLQSLQQFDAAHAVFDSVLAQQPNDFKALTADANLARRSGDPERALQLLRRAVAHDPDSAFDSGPQSDRSLPQGDLGGASLRPARDRATSLAWLQIGILERSAGRFEASVEAMERAYAVDPANMIIRRRLARAHRGLGNQARSDELMSLFKRQERLDKQAASRGAEQALLGNDTEGALALYETAIAQNPAQLSLYLGACSALMRLGRADAAAAMLDTAADRCGASPALHARRAQLLRDTGRLREALTVAEQGLRAHAGSLLLWEVVVRLQIAIGEDAQIVHWLAQPPAFRDNERGIVAAMSGDAAAALGNLPDAIAQYQYAAELQPTNPSHQAKLAKVFLARFDLDRTAEHLRAQSELHADVVRARGRTSSAMKSYIGQILNEYRLDAGAMARIHALPAAHAERAAAALALCRDIPENTAVAVATVDAVWQDLMPGVAGHAMPAPIIPRVIVQFWEAPDRPAEVAALMASWAELNPDARYSCFDDRGARAFLAANCGQQTLFAYHRAAVPSLKSDLFKLAYLAHMGGIFADADTRCTAPVDVLLPAAAELVLYRDEVGMLATGFIAAAPGHPVIQLALTHAIGSINRGDTDSLRLSTGPGLITRCWTQLLAADPDGLTGGKSTLAVWSQRSLQRGVSLHCAAAFRAMVPYRSRVAFNKRTYADGRPHFAQDDEEAEALMEEPQPLWDDHVA